MTQRDVDLAAGPALEILDAVWTWNDLQPDDPTDDSVKVFTDNANMKFWFESIKHHLGSVEGSSGFPLLYYQTGNSSQDSAFGTGKSRGSAVVCGGHNCRCAILEQTLAK